MKLIGIDCKFTINGYYETLVPEDATEEEITNLLMDAIYKGLIHNNIITLNKMKYKEIK